MKREDVPAGVMNLLQRLKTYKVDWKFSFVPTEDVTYEPGIDRETSDLDEANVVSSEHATTLRYELDSRGEPVPVASHVVAIDLDVPAYLVPSSTPGHNHLYIDVPLGIPHDDYMELLSVLAKCKIIEDGYAEVSRKRGHSDLRLPWVSKGDQHLHEPDTPGVNLTPVPATTEESPF